MSNLNDIKKINCPRCLTTDFDEVEEVRSHIIKCHCMFCGRSKDLTPVQVLEDINRGIYEKFRLLLLPIDDKRASERYRGGFTPKVARELIASSDVVVDSEGPLTHRESLEFENINKEIQKGKVCSDCRLEYDNLLASMNSV